MPHDRSHGRHETWPVIARGVHETGTAADCAINGGVSVELGLMDTLQLSCTPLTPVFLAIIFFRRLAYLLLSAAACAVPSICCRICFASASLTGAALSLSPPLWPGANNCANSDSRGNMALTGLCIIVVSAGAAWTYSTAFSLNFQNQRAMLARQ